MRMLLLALGFVGLVAVSTPYLQAIVHAATCVGDTPCNACKNCKYCGYCAKRGGKCGVCKR